MTSMTSVINMKVEPWEDRVIITPAGGASQGGSLD